MVHVVGLWSGETSTTGTKSRERFAEVRHEGGKNKTKQTNKRKVQLQHYNTEILFITSYEGRFRLWKRRANADYLFAVFSANCMPCSATFLF